MSKDQYNNVSVSTQKNILLQYFIDITTDTSTPVIHSDIQTTEDYILERDFEQNSKVVISDTTFISTNYGSTIEIHELSTESFHESYTSESNGMDFGENKHFGITSSIQIPKSIITVTVKEMEIITLTSILTVTFMIIFCISVCIKFSLRKPKATGIDAGIYLYSFPFFSMFSFSFSMSYEYKLTKTNNR